MAFRYEGKIPTMEYKTLRYPGHARIMEAIRELGLLEQEPIDVKGHKVAPRDVAIAAMAPRLTKPAGRDLVALRVEATGRTGGQSRTVGFELIDRYDEEKGISAMMRTTGYSLAITARHRTLFSWYGPSLASRCCFSAHGMTWCGTRWRWVWPWR